MPSMMRRDGFADRARRGEGPSFLECLSERFASHSTAVRETRTAEEMSLIRKRCPIVRLAACLEAEGTLDAVEQSGWRRDVESVVEEDRSL